MVFAEASGCVLSRRAATRVPWAVSMLVGLGTVAATAGVTAFTPQAVNPLAITGAGNRALADVAVALQIAADDPPGLGFAELGVAERPNVLDFVLSSDWGRPAFGPPVGADIDLGSSWSAFSATGPGSVSHVIQPYDFNPPQAGDRQVVPTPEAVVLASLGVALVGSMKRRM